MQLELKISAEKVGKSCTNPDLKKQRVKSRRSGRCVLYVLNVISWIAVVKLYRNTNWTVILVWLTWQLKEVCIPSIYIVCINFHLLELAQVTMWTFVKTNIFTPPLKVLQRQPTSNELYYLWTVLLLDLLDFGTMIVLWLWDFFLIFHIQATYLAPSSDSESQVTKRLFVARKKTLSWWDFLWSLIFF